MSNTTRRELSFTLERIRSIEPEAKRIFVYDSKTDGLRVQVTPAGSRTFQYYSWVKNLGPVTITIGRFPKTTLSDARKKAVALAGEISQRGKAVIEDLQAERTEQTFDDLFDSWFKDQKVMGKRDLGNVKSRYDNHIKSTIGNKRPSALTEKYLRSWFLGLPNRKKLQGEGTISNTTANRCLEIVSAIFAAKTGSNPAATIKHFHEESRERYLSGDELANLFEALEHQDTPEQLRDIVLLALTTGARKMNLLSMTWQDVDLANMLWIIPAAISKNKKSMGVPLISEAMDILVRRKKTASSIFVFPSSCKGGHLVDIRHAWATLLKRAEITDFVFHDLRRTAGSWQAHIGSSDIIIGKSLGHSSTQSTRVYARIRDNNPVRNSLAGGFAAMVEASKEKKVVSLVGK